MTEVTSASRNELKGVLAGIRVIDLSTVFAAPYIGGLLRDMGAEVIKVEPPARLDQTRGTAFGPYLDNEPGTEGWNWSGTYHSLNRGKKGLVLDLKQPAGRDVLRELIRTADILLENFTPRVMQGWGMTYDELAGLNPRLIMLSNTGYGGTGPWSSFKAQGTTLEATMGLTAYTGYPGDKPKKVVQSYPDFLAAWTGLTAIHASLLEREETGRGRWIDLGMYELGAVVIPEAFVAVQSGEPILERTGNEVPGTLYSGLIRCGVGDDWLAVSLTDERMVLAASTVVPGLPSALGDAETRHAAAEALAAWASSLQPDDAAQVLQSVGVAASPVNDIPRLIQDEQYVARGFFEWVWMTQDARPVVGRPYRWNGRRSVHIRGRGPRIGEHNDAVLEALGMGADEINDLRAAAVVTDQPVGVKPPRPANVEAMVSSGLFKRVDPDYREVLQRASRRARIVRAADVARDETVTSARGEEN